MDRRVPCSYHATVPAPGVLPHPPMVVWSTSNLEWNRIFLQSHRPKMKDFAVELYLAQAMSGKVRIGLGANESKARCSMQAVYLAHFWSALQRNATPFQWVIQEYLSHLVPALTPQHGIWSSSVFFCVLLIFWSSLGRHGSTIGRTWLSAHHVDAAPASTSTGVECRHVGGHMCLNI